MYIFHINYLQGKLSYAAASFLGISICIVSLTTPVFFEDKAFIASVASFTVGTAGDEDVLVLELGLLEEETECDKIYRLLHTCVREGDLTNWADHKHEESPFLHPFCRMKG